MMYFSDFSLVNSFLMLSIVFASCMGVSFYESGRDNNGKGVEWKWPASFGAAAFFFGGWFLKPLYGLLLSKAIALDAALMIGISSIVFSILVVISFKAVNDVEKKLAEIKNISSRATILQEQALCHAVTAARYAKAVGMNKNTDVVALGVVLPLFEAEDRDDILRALEYLAEDEHARRALDRRGRSYIAKLLELYPDDREIARAVKALRDKYDT